jgi:hypothetical protein
MRPKSLVGFFLLLSGTALRLLGQVPTVLAQTDVAS